MTAIEHKPSPNFDARKDGKKPHILLLHYTGMKTAQDALDRLRHPESKVSCHYVIDEDGKIFSLVDESMRAWHAGIGYWRGETDINSASIGIEMVNPGHEWGYRAFPLPQMESAIILCHDIISRHQIKPEFILGHSDTAIARKIDPGELFDWQYLSLHNIGLYPSHPISPRIMDTIRVQKMLGAFGYKIDPTGMVDAQTLDAITALQRHYAPALMGSGLSPLTIGVLADLCQRCGIAV